ncbi:MAG: type VI secretion system baseplate subunit TssG [Ideonella sp. MAG2]|nr:MAG: type VI secretion system baseplate subunit TssG [Ideonella sp. MAG2]
MNQSVIQRLFSRPERYGFFQAVRLLHRWFSQQERLHGPAVFEQKLKFRNALSMSFPASEVAAFDVKLHPRDDDSPPNPGPLPRPQDIARLEMTPAFMGLLGAGGALPLFYTELFSRRETYERDFAGRAFLDIFLHRSVVLFYQAWRKHRLAIRFEDDPKHQFLPLVLSLAGLGHPALRDRLRAREGGVSDFALAHFAGLLQQRPVSATTLRRVLASYFGVPVQVEQFVGRWFTLPRENQTQLGLGGAGLGKGAVTGQRIWQRDLRMRLTLGPMSAERFRRFLPGGPGALALEELLTLLCGTTLEFEVKLALQAQAVQGTSLGGTSAGPGDF